MPKWLRRYLSAASPRTHFVRALLAGAVLRALSAWFVYGPQALDDYKHGVYPAYQFWAGLPLDLPDYRSHLLVWLLAGFAQIASFFGVTSALGQVRAMYLGLGAISLLGVYGTYIYAKSFVRPGGARHAPHVASLLPYLVAVYPVMPFVSTRAFGEAVALAFVALGFGFLESARRERGGGFACFTMGFVSLGIATLFRFHCGLLFVVYGLILLGLRRWPGVLAGLVGGTFTLLAQMGIDQLSHKPPLGTLWSYLAENEGGGARYGASPWYNTWAFAAVLVLLPFSAPLLRHVRALWRDQWPVLISWLVFVLAHSLAAHKEERFLYPTLALELWALGELWVAGSFSGLARRVFNPVLFGVSGVALFVVCFVNTQEGEIEPPAFVQSRYKDVIYLDYESLFGASRFQFYFLRPPSELATVAPSEFTATRIDDELQKNETRQAVVMLTSDPDAQKSLRALENVRTAESQCLDMREAGSLIDRLLYKANPRHNQRRRPTWYLICERVEGNDHG